MNTILCLWTDEILHLGLFKQLIQNNCFQIGVAVNGKRKQMLQLRSFLQGTYNKLKQRNN